MQYSMRRVMHRLLASDRAEYEYNSSCVWPVVWATQTPQTSDGSGAVAKIAVLHTSFVFVNVELRVQQLLDEMLPTTRSSILSTRTCWPR